MAKPFDATLKDLVEKYPQDWGAQLGVPAGLPVEVIDADLSTVTTQADRVLRIGGPSPWLLHVELQSSRDTALSRRILKYNVLLHERHALPAHSAAILLRPAADAAELTGEVRYEPIPGKGSLLFRHEVVRIWRQPVDRVLEGGLGTLPLVPLTDIPEATLPGAIHRMEERITAETTPAEAATLWTSTYILMGLRYSPDAAARILQGVRAMRESSTYQAIIEEGQVEGIRKTLFIQGEKRFGAADPSTRRRIESINSVERLERLSERLLDVSSWDELLA